MNSDDHKIVEARRQALLGQIKTAESALRSGLHTHGFGNIARAHLERAMAHTRWPRSTYPGIIQRLTNLRLLDYVITVNVDPLPVTKEIIGRLYQAVAGRQFLACGHKFSNGTTYGKIERLEQSLGFHPLDAVCG
jgi:hypothetical protein